jgi:25S rRNA (uracil2843-N3)-methyltransferase
MGPRRPSSKVNAVRTARSHKETAKESEDPDSDHGDLPLELQQAILDQFSRAFPFQDAANLKATIQEVKGHLYNRDFGRAFGKAEYLQAYALRWSASRALCYAGVFSQLEVLQKRHERQGPDALQEQRASRIVCIGGGAGAEVEALAAVMHASDTELEVIAVDLADWSSALEGLGSVLVTPPPLSAYASEAVRSANKSMIEPERLKLEFVQKDILECKDEELKEILGGVELCTIMFTLNELFTSSISKTTALLLGLSEVMDRGAWLVVVDSPGSYSEISLGKEQKTKQYPMKWLLDHTLMEVANGKWEKVVEDESRWFRVPAGLNYPLDLENMRYQIHLYRRE